MAEGSSAEVKHDDNTLTLVDFLEEELQLECDANAVLGPSDDKNCTYNVGYIQRQALYACVTCTPQDTPSSKPAGICLACSYHCHEGHDLVELYTKRFFRCDCGNSKFNGKKCNLVSNKSSENEKNVYNQNFSGLYCTCARPYPDPEDDIADEMLQCMVCEDWFHTRHLHNDVPPGTNYAEMICGSCTDKLPFLKFYLGLTVQQPTKEDANGSTETAKNDISIEITENQTNGIIQPPSKVAETSEVEHCDKEVKNVNGFLPQEQNGICLIEKMKVLERTHNGATFWPSNFRSSLCQCSKCLSMYGELKVPWIIDDKDTVQAYEEKGKQCIDSETHSNTQYEAGMKALSRLDRFRQVEVIQNYNEFKSELRDYLSKFVENGKVVREEDIHEFFSEIQAKKRQKVGIPPYNCH